MGKSVFYSSLNELKKTNLHHIANIKFNNAKNPMHADKTWYYAKQP